MPRSGAALKHDVWPDPNVIAAQLLSRHGIADGTTPADAAAQLGLKLTYGYPSAVLDADADTIFISPGLSEQRVKAKVASLVANWLIADATKNEDILADENAVRHSLWNSLMIPEHDFCIKFKANHGDVTNLAKAFAVRPDDIALRIMQLEGSLALS